MTTAADKMAEALQRYMAAFGQGLEAHGIPMGEQQRLADEDAREALSAYRAHVAQPASTEGGEVVEGSRCALASTSVTMETASLSVTCLVETDGNLRFIQRA